MSPPSSRTTLRCSRAQLVDASSSAGRLGDVLARVLADRAGRRRRLGLGELRAAGRADEVRHRRIASPGRARNAQAAAQPADAAGMEITDVASTSMLAKSLDGVRTVLAQAQAAPSTPDAQAAVILQLSSAAQNLLS